MRIFKSKQKAINQRNGMLFVLPGLIGFACFFLYPVIISIYYSFCTYNIFSPPQWIGLDNFVDLFKDELFWISLYNTIFYTVFFIFPEIGIAITLALLLNLKIKGMAFYRSIFYLPVIVPLVASSILWMWILNPQYGILNAFLGKIGIEGPGWLADPKWSKPALILMGWWIVGESVIIYLACLQNISRQLYEAAEIDGANWWQNLTAITIPMITPAIFFQLVIGLIYSFQYFTQAYIMTSGGPVHSTEFYSLYLFKNAFAYFKMGYASAMAWLLFVLILITTLVVFKSSIKWVYYEVE